MKNGIIVFSQTGNTLQVAQRLRDGLIQGGGEVELLRVQTADSEPTPLDKVVLTERPDPASFDRVFFGAPVWAFSLCAPMRAYLQGLGSLKGKRVSVFVTHQFPFPWMGGSRAVRQMAALCRDKGAAVEHTAVVNWGGKDREGQIREAAGKLAGE